MPWLFSQEPFDREHHGVIRFFLFLFFFISQVFPVFQIIIMSIGSNNRRLFISLEIPSGVKIMRKIVLDFGGS